MAKITDTSADYWATTDDVRDKVKARRRGEEIDAESEIEAATREMRSKWAGATGKDPAAAPDTPPPLLQDATAWLAAEEIHGKLGAQSREDSRDENATNYYRMKAKAKFKAWKEAEDLEPSSADVKETSVSGRSSTIGDLPTTRDL